MSIITEALNRLQVERSRLTDQPEPESSVPETTSESALSSEEEPSLSQPEPESSLPVTSSE